MHVGILASKAAYLFPMKIESFQKLHAFTILKVHNQD